MYESFYCYCLIKAMNNVTNTRLSLLGTHIELYIAPRNDGTHIHSHSKIAIDLVEQYVILHKETCGILRRHESSCARDPLHVIHDIRRGQPVPSKLIL